MKEPREVVLLEQATANRTKIERIKFFDFFTTQKFTLT
jgi:hypothetical protein